MAAVALVVLVLGACGGDDSGGEQAAGPDTTAAPQRTGTAGEGETTRTQTEPQGAQEAVPELELEEDQEPAPEGAAPDERTGRPPTYDRAKPLTKDQLKAIERPIYEQARYFCNRVGVEVLRREYRVESSDPEDVAREAARRTYQRAARDAVFSGCLAGLRAGD